LYPEKNEPKCPSDVRKKYLYRHRLLHSFIELWKKEGEMLAKFVENRTKIRLFVGQIKRGRIRAKTMA
jgi:hypothetical protein